MFKQKFYPDQTIRVKTTILFIVFLLSSSISYGLDSLEVILTFEDSNDFFRYNFFNKGYRDLNNDGYSDFIYDSDINNKMKVYFGSNPPDTLPVYVQEFYHPEYFCLPSWSGDLNNDGYNDIIYNIAQFNQDWGDVYICLGSDSLDLEPELILHGYDYVDDAYCLGFRGTNGGYDFNGDGYDDILAGGSGPSYFFNGLVTLFFGGVDIDDEPDFYIQGNELDQFGISKTVGDINGDGYDDLIVSRNIQEFCNLKYEIYLGGEFMDNIMDFELEKIYDYDEWGKKPSAYGDINGDGCDDLIIITDTKIDIYFGSQSGEIFCDTLNYTDGIGHSFYCNINNDEYDDIMVLNDTNDKIYAFFGCEDFNPDTEPSLILNFDNNISRFYMSGYIANFGDFNGDGYNEFLLNFGNNLYPPSLAKVYQFTNNEVDENMNYNSIVITNFPNPFTTITNISFSLNITNYVKLDIYNIKGQKIKTLVNNQIVKGGNHEITWDGTNSRNESVGSGIYFIKLRTEECVNVKKIVRLDL